MRPSFLLTLLPFVAVSSATSFCSTVNSIVAAAGQQAAASAFCTAYLAKTSTTMKKPSCLAEYKTAALINAACKCIVDAASSCSSADVKSSGSTQGAHYESLCGQVVSNPELIASLPQPADTQADCIAYCNAHSPCCALTFDSVAKTCISLDLPQVDYCPFLDSYTKVPSPSGDALIVVKGY